MCVYICVCVRTMLCLSVSLAQHSNRPRNRSDLVERASSAAAWQKGEESNISRSPYTSVSFFQRGRGCGGGPKRHKPVLHTPEHINQIRAPSVEENKFPPIKIGRILFNSVPGAGVPWQALHRELLIFVCRHLPRASAGRTS